MNTKNFNRIQMQLSGLNSWISKENYFFKWRYIAPILIALILYSFLDNIKGVFVVGTLAVAASYSTIYKRVFRIPSAIELVTLGTVITSITYGPVPGLVFGVMTTLASEIISSGVDMFTVLYMVVRGLIGVVAFYLAGWNIVVLGIAMVLMFNLICQPFYMLPGDIETKIKGIYFFIMNITFNFVAFFLLGNILLSIAA